MPFEVEEAEVATRARGKRAVTVLASLLPPHKSKGRARAKPRVPPTDGLPGPASVSESRAGGQIVRATHRRPAASPAPKSRKPAAANGAVPPSALVPLRAPISPDEGGQRRSATHRRPAAPVPPSLPDAIGNLAKLHRSRLNFVSAKVKIELQIKAIQRQEHARAGCEKKTHALCPGVYKVVTPDIQILRVMALDPLEHQAEARLRAMLDELPAVPAHVLDFVDNIRGLGRPSLAQIIAEAGDLAHYANPAKLWSRMGLGLAPDGNTRYEGRSPRRRALMAVIGTNFLRAGGPYKELYDQRKEYERTKPSCGKALKNAKGEPIGECKDADGAACCKAGHIHNRTLRYIEKRLLLDLWRAWNPDLWRAWRKAA